MALDVPFQPRWQLSLTKYLIFGSEFSY